MAKNVIWGAVIGLFGVPFLLVLLGAILTGKQTGPSPIDANVIFLLALFFYGPFGLLIGAIIGAAKFVSEQGMSSNPDSEPTQDFIFTAIKADRGSKEFAWFHRPACTPKLLPAVLLSASES